MYGLLLKGRVSCEIDCPALDIDALGPRRSGYHVALHTGDVTEVLTEAEWQALTVTSSQLLEADTKAAADRSPEDDRDDAASSTQICQRFHVKAKNAARYEAGLASALHHLCNVEMGNHEAVWQATFEVISWLYLCDQAERHPDKDAYYEHRRASSDGRALGGLIGLRGLIVHHQVDFQDLAPVPVTWGGQPVTWGGEPVTWGVELRWPPHRTPPWPDPAKDERVTMYQEYVAGQPLLEPLKRAHRYLLSR